MTTKSLVDKVKQLREITGVGFKDCKDAIDQCNGDIDKSIDFLRKKGISKANKKMQRIAADGLVAISEEQNKISIIEINCETDFVAKNDAFINFVESLSKLNLLNSGSMEKLLLSKMENNKDVNENLINLISKIGEKISIRRTTCFDEESLFKFSYVHTAIKKNLGKLGVILSLESSLSKKDILDFGHKLSMHIAATNPLSIDSNDLDLNILKKEEEIIVEELKNSGKDPTIVEKIAKGKLKKFVEDNTLLNQDWVIDPKKKVKDIISDIAKNGKINIKKFIRYKVGEGI